LPAKIILQSFAYDDGLGFTAVASAVFNGPFHGWGHASFDEGVF
jgi:hypothetical protein